MYNKNRFRKVNEKKLLRKIGKHWVVTSVSLLGALLNVSGLTDQSIQAEAQATPRAKTTKTRGKIAPRRDKLVPSQANLTARSVNPSQNLQSANGSKDLSHQVRSLYQRIMNHARLDTSLHQARSIDNDQWKPQANDPATSSSKIVRGYWGTAPFSFNPKTGLLQTTGKGVIEPVSKTIAISDNSSKPVSQLKGVKLQDIRDIKFAPGTQAPSSHTLSDGALFGTSMTPVQTTDGASDSTAYISGLCNLSDIDCTNLDTRNMTNMGGMFRNDTGLKNIQFGPKFDTHNVTEMSVMFYNDINLQSLDLSHFDTSNVAGLTSMFQSDYALADLNLGPHFNTGRAAYMSDIFHSDNSLKHLNLGNQFYVSNGYNEDPINLSDMFKNDYKLQSLNLGPHFNTAQVNNMSDMFANDSDLDSLNLGNQFYTGEVPDMHNMFNGDTNLKSLNLGPYFDTLRASETSFNNSNTDNGETVSNAYNGAQDVFAGDDSLNHLIMNNTRLAGPVNLPHDALATWRQRQNDQPMDKDVNLTDGNVYSGDYGRYATRPVQKTCLNLVDSNGKSIGDVFVNGLKGTNIPFATISNVLGDGYVPKITTHDIITTYPNSPYKYNAGVINVTVTKDGNSSNNGNSKPVSGAVPQSAVNSYAASVADQSIESSEMKSVASSVSVANADKARDAAQLADTRIATSLKNSVADSVAIENQSLANQAAKLADQRIATSLSNSVTTSVSAANQNRAAQAASSADAKLATSLSNSVSASVSTANQSKAQQAAKSADASLESSIGNSYAQSADRSLVASARASVSTSVSVVNQAKAERAAKLADQRIATSLASSVAASVSTANQSRAAQAARSADAKISASLSNSVSASVSTANQSKAQQAAKNADASLESSLASSYAQSADQSLVASAKASVSASVSVANRAKAEQAAKSADQRIATSQSNSVANSISEANARVARSAARSADDKLMASERNSVATSVATANRNRADFAAESADAKIAASAKASVASSVSIANQAKAQQAAKSADVSLENSMASSYAQSADRSLAASTRASVAHQSKADQISQSASQRLKRSTAVSEVNSATQELQEFLRNSVAASLSTRNQQTARSGSINADRPVKRTSTSVVRSAVPQPNSSLAASYSNDADQRIEASLQASIHGSLSTMSQSNSVNNVKATMPSTEPRSTEPQSLNQPRSLNSSGESQNQTPEIHKSLPAPANVKPEEPSRPVARVQDNPQENNQRPLRVNDPTPVNSEPLGDGMSNDGSQSTPVPTQSTSSIDTSAEPTGSINAQGTDQARGRKSNLRVTQIPVHRHYFMVRKDCLAHNHLMSVGKNKDYSTVLRRHVTGRIEKAFKVQRGHHVAYRYEIKLGHHRCFITASQSFVKGTQHRLPNVSHFNFNKNY